MSPPSSKQRSLMNTSLPMIRSQSATRVKRMRSGRPTPAIQRLEIKRASEITAQTHQPPRLSSKDDSAHYLAYSLLIGNP
ncbi:hypothetical protein NUW54_g14520 [Trametes sanguinea]|uniref:Uncharacterized protein n=1 Tax=Trametes sanguinea TaxID=158606 RepID=A0ACC1MC06_9APHY|nr:hypothetical protein NUW54_g14520 [Trametes sanguinea]